MYVRQCFLTEPEKMKCNADQLGDILKIHFTYLLIDDYLMLITMTIYYRDITTSFREVKYLYAAFQLGELYKMF